MSMNAKSTNRAIDWLIEHRAQLGEWLMCGEISKTAYRRERGIVDMLIGEIKRLGKRR